MAASSNVSTDPQERTESEHAGQGCLAEVDGRNFMLLLDMCHFLVDHLTGTHNFADLQAASLLRSTDSQACVLLTARMYSYWYAAPAAGKGIFERLVDWAALQTEGDAASIHALALNQCAQWPRRRKTGTFFFGGEDKTGAALLVDAKLDKVYRVLGISTSIGNLIRANGKGGDGMLGTSLLLTLLPFMDVIVYDATLQAADASSHVAGFVEKVLARARAAVEEGTVVARLPQVTDAPLVGVRVVISGLQAKPELNGKRGVANSFHEPTGRCVRVCIFPTGRCVRACVCFFTKRVPLYSRAASWSSSSVLCCPEIMCGLA
jgi:hypothetical protein